jgi:hypothetical protein
MVTALTFLQTHLAAAGSDHTMGQAQKETLKMDTQIRLERRKVPRNESYLQAEPLNLAANPALLADVRSAISAAEVDPRSVNCWVHGHRVNLCYARYLVQIAIEKLEEATYLELQRMSEAERPSAQGLACGCGCGESGCGNPQCLPAKQVTL